MAAESENIANLFPSLDFPCLMPWEAVRYIRAAVARSQGGCSQWEAAQILIDAIKCGRLLAYGDDHEGQERVIPIDDFALTDAYPGSAYPNEDSRRQCVFRWFDDGHRGINSDFIEKGGRVVWRNINVDTGEVRRLWPWQGSAQKVETESIDDRDGVRAPLKALTASEKKKVKKFCESCGPGNEDDQWRQAQTVLGRYFSREEFRDVRRRVPKAFGVVGAPRKSSRRPPQK